MKGRFFLEFSQEGKQVYSVQAGKASALLEGAPVIAHNTWAAFQSLPVGWFGGDCRGECHSWWPGWSVLLPFAVGCSVVHPHIGILAIVAYTNKGLLYTITV